MKTQRWTVFLVCLVAFTLCGASGRHLRAQPAKPSAKPFDVKAFGAVGDGSTDDTDAVRRALEAASANRGGTVRFPAGLTFLLTDELMIPSYVGVEAKGATLVWTRFGSKLATTPDQEARTGNGIRLNSNTAWDGGTLRMANVPEPTGTVIPKQDMSGAFWNQIVIGHFNNRTSTTVGTFTENVTVSNVHFELQAGRRSSVFLIGGAARNLTITNVTDNNLSDDLKDTEFLETTWGAGPDGLSFHPYNINILGVTLDEHGSSKGSRRGIHISGSYAIHLKDIRVSDASLPVTFYIGDVGDPGGNPIRVNPEQAGKIASNLTLDGFTATNFNIGIQVLGDSRGSTTHEYGSHSVKLSATNIHLQGQGPAEGHDQWTSNTCIYISDASDAHFSGGDLSGCYEGVAVKTPAAGAAYVAPSGLVFDNLTIHDMARNGIAAGTVNGIRISNCKIHSVGKMTSLPIRAAIVGGGANAQIVNNTLGKADDETTAYGIYWRAADPAKSDGKNNAFCSNQIVRAKAEPIGIVGSKVSKDEQGCTRASVQ